MGQGTSRQDFPSESCTNRSATSGSYPSPPRICQHQTHNTARRQWEWRKGPYRRVPIKSERRAWKQWQLVETESHRRIQRQNTSPENRNTRKRNKRQHQSRPESHKSLSKRVQVSNGQARIPIWPRFRHRGPAPSRYQTKLQAERYYNNKGYFRMSLFGAQSRICFYRQIHFCHVYFTSIRLLLRKPNMKAFECEERLDPCIIKRFLSG